VDKVKDEAIVKEVLSLLAMAAMEVITDSNPVFYGSCCFIGKTVFGSRSFGRGLSTSSELFHSDCR
jgi:hypothetical protein